MKTSFSHYMLCHYGFFTYAQHANWVFHKETKLAIMPILTSEALLREKNPVTKCYPPVGIEPRPVIITSDSKSNTILSTLTWHVLLGRSLNFCSSTIWYLDLDDLRGINRAWLYKELKVSVLQAFMSSWCRKSKQKSTCIWTSPGGISAPIWSSVI